MILSVSGVTADTSDPLNGAGVTPVYAGLFVFICMLRFYPNKTKTERPTLSLSPQQFELRIYSCHRTILSQNYPNNPNDFGP